MNKNDHEKDVEIKYVSKKEDIFYIEKKMSFFRFIILELVVFLCITFASYFSILITSQFLTTEESFSKSFNLVFEYFTIQNLFATSLGLWIMMGILYSINHTLTDSKLNIQPILNRLSKAIADFYYLMFSTILGYMMGLLHFLHNFPEIKDYNQLHNLAINGIITIFLIGTSTAVALQFLMNQNKIIKPSSKS